MPLTLLLLGTAFATDSDGLLDCPNEGAQKSGVWDVFRGEGKAKEGNEAVSRARQDAQRKAIARLCGSYERISSSPSLEAECLALLQTLDYGDFTGDHTDPHDVTRERGRHLACYTSAIKEAEGASQSVQSYEATRRLAQQLRETLGGAPAYVSYPEYPTRCHVTTQRGGLLQRLVQETLNDSTLDGDTPAPLRVQLEVRPDGSGFATLTGLVVDDAEPEVVTKVTTVEFPDLWLRDDVEATPQPFTDDAACTGDLPPKIGRVGAIVEWPADYFKKSVTNWTVEVDACQAPPRAGDDTTFGRVASLRDGGTKLCPRGMTPTRIDVVEYDAANKERTKSQGTYSIHEGKLELAPFVKGTYRITARRSLPAARPGQHPFEQTQFMTLRAKPRHRGEVAVRLGGLPLPAGFLDDSAPAQVALDARIRGAWRLSHEDVSSGVQEHLITLSGGLLTGDLLRPDSADVWLANVGYMNRFLIGAGHTIGIQSEASLGVGTARTVRADAFQQTVLLETRISSGALILFESPTRADRREDGSFQSALTIGPTLTGLFVNDTNRATLSLGGAGVASFLF